MLILALRTDKPEAELYLLESLNSDAITGSEVWQAHRTLAETLHSRIQKLLSEQRKTVHDLTGIIVYAGPGSFTGLRIGATVANALATALNIPAVGSTGDYWIKLGLELLPLAADQKTTVATIVIPQYGSEPHITTPKK